MSDDIARHPTDSGKNNSNSTTPSANKFVGSGFLLFTDLLLIALTNWIFWLVISKFASTSEVGQATSIASLVMLVALVTSLGFEYPLLKLSSSNRSRIFGTIFAAKIAITAASLPIMAFVITNFFGYPLQHEFVWVAIATVLVSSVSFVARFTLLGISNVKHVLIFEVLGTITKFALGVLLLLMGYGVLGLLLSFLFAGVVTSVGLLFHVKRLSFQFGLGDAKFFKEVTKEGLFNAPSKLSRLFILNLSVVLLASLAVDPSDVGIFYIALMISSAAASFAASIAYMAIPASSISKRDLTASSTRIGLSLTVPVITAIIASPGSILSLIGQEYVLAGDALFILGIGILPSIIGLNAISQLNTAGGKSKEILAIGMIQIIGFLASFYILAPQYGILGAAYSILIGLIGSAVPSAIWLGRASMKHILFSVVAIGVGWSMGGEFAIGVAHIHPAGGIIIACAVSFGIIILSKNTSLGEMKQIVKMALPSR
jgi:O-antigen/teichoic acid export membrane protein